MCVICDMYCSVPETVPQTEEDAAWSEWGSCLTTKPLFDFNKHSSAILHFDFTADMKYIQVR